MPSMPTLFISHGSPDIALAETPATSFLKELRHSLPRPRAIVVASAHFEAEGGVAVSGDAAPETIHDFGGFAPELYELAYPAPGDPSLAEEIAAAVRGSGLRTSVMTRRGFDHGAWVPLLLAFPEADIPVVQVSVDPSHGPDHHLKLGEALSFLRERDVLLVGSGSLTHNLRAAFGHLRAGVRDADTPAWVTDFAAWMTDRLVSGDRAALADYRLRAPHALENHPTDEHLMPLYVALGAAGEGARAERLHESRDYGVLAMEAFAFH
ncbi:dioxygenase [Aurantimonas sp. VKM B-3413]|uniref:dioxygenase family protein n=1 Tax=Aurantimonas sp. VKM B-3413 TaxID=2779401 RepID=UPI001E485BC1|nr:class III extradiol ring-cleavage dioxygenase [Aurantimonas sp. VKM B-3413]MCB8837491.1 dioxygenase [Aurantimonas sp. VKM B-3413]